MHVFAYLDPGTASALLAGIIALFAGLGAALRTFGRNTFGRLMFWRKDDSAPKTESTTKPSAEDEPARRR